MLRERAEPPRSAEQLLDAAYDRNAHLAVLARHLAQTVHRLNRHPAVSFAACPDAACCEAFAALELHRYKRPLA